MKRYIEPVSHILVWVAGFLIFAFGVKTIGVFHRSDGSFLYPLLSGTVINLVIFYATAFYLIPRLSVNKRASVFILLILLLLAGATLVETLTDYFFFVSIYSSSRESFASQAIVNLGFNLVILCFALAYGFTRNWIKSERTRQKLKEDKLQAELNFLKAQINPHFLFNVLNMAFSTATASGDEKTAGIIEKLAGMMRYMLYESNSARVGVDREIGYIQDFIELQKMRLSPEIPVSVNVEITGKYDHLGIAPLMLIPFVENAFKHGIRFDRSSIIDIQFEFKANSLIFSVINTRFDDARSSSKDSGIGLANVRKRLELIYPGNHDLSIEEKKDLFSVRLNLNLMRLPHEMHGR